VHCADSPELPGVIEIAVGIPDAASDRVVFRDAIGALKVRYGFLRSSGHLHASPFKYDAGKKPVDVLDSVMFRIVWM
jgi:hypothetical protein